MKAFFRKVGSALARGAQSLRALFSRSERDLARARVYWDDGVSLTLSNLAQETETRASGRVQVISLADFRTAVGELWDKYQSKILIIVESTIARMIGRGNTFIPQGDDTWLLLFPSLDEEKAEQRTNAIAASIGKKLVGAQFTPEELPLPSAAKLDLSGAMNADGSLNMDALRNAISRVRQKQILKTVAQSPHPAGPRPRPVTAGAAPQRSNADQLKPFFRPAWSADTQNIDTFFFRAFTDAGLNVYADSAPVLNDATVLDLTKNAASAFTAMCEGGLMAKIAIPVPFNTLHGPAGPEVLRIISALRQRDRLMRLRIEVVRVPESVTSELLVPIREMFRAYVREVAFMVDLLSPHAQILALDHIMLGVEVGHGHGGGGEQVYQEMLIFRQRAGRRGTYILGLHSRSDMMHAVRAGFSEIGGPALHEDTRRLPLHLTHILREDLLAP
ncbi:MAG: hypothetical protein K2P94_02475 [Rhodospirillaceae bacterium]|nr:hypothetical protein [Rhodospirillaceae bacterium]